MGFYKHTGGTHSTVCNISGTSLPNKDTWWPTDSLVGCILHNMTDSSYGTITANTNNSITVSSLTGGTDNDFDVNDIFWIMNPQGSSQWNYPEFGSLFGENYVLDDPDFDPDEPLNTWWAPQFLSMHVFNNDTTAGGWAGNTDFWMSYIYEGDQESQLTYMGRSECAGASKKQIQVIVNPVNVAGKLVDGQMWSPFYRQDTSWDPAIEADYFDSYYSNDGTFSAQALRTWARPKPTIWNVPPRITGARIYWSDVSDLGSDAQNEKWLLYDIDFNKGVRKGDSNSSFDLTTTTDEGTDDRLKFQAWSLGVTGAFGPSQTSDGDGGCPQTEYPETGNHSSGVTNTDVCKSNVCFLQIENYTAHNVHSGDVNGSVQFDEPLNYTLMSK